MIDICNQCECEECIFYRDEENPISPWCSFWSLDDGDAVVEPHGYCYNAIKREDNNGEID